MKMLMKEEKYRLFQVADEVNEQGLYDLTPFDNEAYNREFDIHDLNDELDGLSNYMYGGGQFFEIADVIEPGFLIECIDGKIRIHYNDDVIKIRDITDQIDTDPDDSTFFILVSKDYSEYSWIVAVSQGVEYSDC